MRNLIFLLVSIIFIGISTSVAEAAVFFTTPTDTPNLSDMATAVRTPLDCVTPGSGLWTISQDCFLASNFNAPANVIVQNGAILVIPNGVQLNIDFVNSNLTIKFGSGVLIKAGGSIT